MRKDPIVASNYARALLQVVKKSAMPLQDALDESRQLRQLLCVEQKLRVFLEGPQFREEDKEKLIANLFHGRLSEVFFQFSILLLRRDRIEYFIDILDEFEKLVEHEQGLTLGLVTTAVELGEDEKNQLRQRLEAKTGLRFDMRFQVNPALIGGVKVQYKDVLLDTTIQSYLIDLKQKLKHVRLAI